MKGLVVKNAGIAAVFLLALGFAGCRQDVPRLKDGYYLAEAENYDDYGWKEYVSVFINNNRIVSVEYNAINKSGLIKSWDMEYMRTMNAVSKTYPNEYARYYVTALLETQNPGKVDVLTGATTSFIAFRLLSSAALARARRGDKNVNYVDIPKPEER
jgi:major membrane immunogen (membrane-anchored lipoprotein)